MPAPPGPERPRSVGGEEGDLLGAAAHGLAVILVVVLGLGQFGILFPTMMLLGLWLVISAFWPIRVETADRAPAGMAAEAG